MAGTPPGFNAERVMAGLHKAMEFGEPTRAADKATFVKIAITTPAGSAVDGNGIPFDPTQRPVRTPTRHTVACAVDHQGRADTAQNFGSLTSDRVEITLLDPEYQIVKGFDFVVIGGTKYLYSKTLPPEALGSIDVWTVICISEDET